MITERWKLHLLDGFFAIAVARSRLSFGCREERNCSGREKKLSEDLGIREASSLPIPLSFLFSFSTQCVSSSRPYELRTCNKLLSSSLLFFVKVRKVSCGKVYCSYSVVLQVVSSAEMAGSFVDPAVFCKLALPHLEASSSGSSSNCSRCLRILAGLLRGSNPQLLKPHLKVGCFFSHAGFVNQSIKSFT